MRYLHPDVLDNGPALIRSNAVFAILIPAFTQNYAQVVASAIITAPVAPSDFTISDQGTGRKLVFGGVTGQSNTALAVSTDLHVAYTDGLSRVLWVEGIRPAVVIGSQNYRLPIQTLISPQPQAA